ncbi:MAG: hypothetical protein ACK564_03365, partial [Novosphingobium sp.]
LAERLNQPGEIAPAIRSLIKAISIRSDHLEVTLDPATLAAADQPSWVIRIPRPTRRPHGEARIRIDAASPNPAASPQLVKLMAEAFEVQALVVASPHLSLNQLAKSIGRCRKQMAKLLSVSWLSPRIVDAIIDGVQPRSINRTRLLETELPVAWAEQEVLLGFTA